MSIPTENFQILERKPDHHYRHEIPNIVDELGLNPYQYRLYGHLKRVAGDSGACWQSLQQIADHTKMCKSVVHRTLDSLCLINPILKKSLIIKQTRKREDGGDATSVYIIEDIWHLNGEFYREKLKLKKSLGIVSHTTPHGTAYHPPMVCGTTKEEPILEEELKKKKERESAAPPSPLSLFLFEEIKKMKVQRGLSAPKPPNFKEWDEQFRLIIERDKRDLDLLKSLILFAMQDDFWYGNILSPSSLRKNFEKLEIDKQASKSKSVKTEDSPNAKANKFNFYASRKKFGAEFADIKVFAYGIRHEPSGKDIGWEENPVRFETTLASLTNLISNRGY